MRKLLFLAVFALTLASCTSINKSMREPNARMEWEKNDFEYSNLVSATAQSTKIVGIDFSRLFEQKTGNVKKDETSISLSTGTTIIAKVPVIGNFISDKTANYALHRLMEENPGYDVVFYPQYTTTVERPIGIGIFTITTVEVTARLAKIKK